VIETHAVPTVTFCTVPFRTLAQVRRESLGIADLPVVYLPHPMMTRTPAELESIADQFVAEVVRHLTQEPR
jgi:hypothetical protein